MPIQMQILAFRVLVALGLFIGIAVSCFNGLKDHMALASEIATEGRVVPGKMTGLITPFPAWFPGQPYYIVEYEFVNPLGLTTTGNSSIAPKRLAEIFASLEKSIIPRPILLPVGYVKKDVTRNMLAAIVDENRQFPYLYFAFELVVGVFLVFIADLFLFLLISLHLGLTSDPATARKIYRPSLRKDI